MQKHSYYTANPAMPEGAKQVKIEEVIQPKINAIMGFTVLIGLLITGYAMIALLVMIHDALITIQNKLNNYELLYKQVYVKCR